MGEDNRPWLYAIEMAEGANMKTVRVVAHDVFRAIKFASDTYPGRMVDKATRISPVDATLLESEKAE